MDRQSIRKPMIIMLACVFLLFGSILIYQIIGKIMLKKYLAMHADKIVIVSSTVAKKQPWQPFIYATGSLRATLGVDVTTELAGMVHRRLHFSRR